EQECNDRLSPEAAKQDAPQELRLALLVNLINLGEQYKHDRKDAEANRCWRQGHELGRRLVKEIPENAQEVVALAACNREFAAQGRPAEPPEKPAELCAFAARLLEAQHARDPADRDCAEALAGVCWSLADSHRQAGKPAEAMQAARRAVEVLAELAE